MSDVTVTNVFLMLAHDGIKNTYIWEEYMKNIHVAIICYVFMPTPETVFDEFTEKYRASNDTCSHPSRWGDASLVEIEIKLMKEALIKYPNAQSFYTISGRDIPVVSSENFCSRNHETCLDSGEQKGFYIKDGGNVKYKLNQINLCNIHFF